MWSLDSFLRAFSWTLMLRRSTSWRLINVFDFNRFSVCDWWNIGFCKLKLILISHCFWFSFFWRRKLFFNINKYTLSYWWIVKASHLRIAFVKIFYNSLFNKNVLLFLCLFLNFWTWFLLLELLKLLFLIYNLSKFCSFINITENVFVVIKSSINRITDSSNFNLRVIVRQPLVRLLWCWIKFWAQMNRNRTLFIDDFWDTFQFQICLFNIML